MHLRTYLQRLWSTGRSESRALADAELLRRWVAHHDPAAFEVLLWRHGPMVLGLCRRLLRHEQDVEDACQSAFLALALKGGSIGKGEAVGSWLYTVASRAALQVRTTAARRETIDPVLLDRREAPTGSDSARELRAVLDEEIGRLPEPYRSAFVLCYLEGLTNEEAARRLGRPVGTIVSRLARARQRLRNRLTRRGLAPAAVAVLLGASATQAALPAPLAGEIIRSAALVAVGEAAAAPAAVVAMTKGVLLAMCMTKAKLVGTILMAVVLLGGAFCAIGIVTEAERSKAQAVMAWQAPRARPTLDPAWRGGSVSMPHSPGMLPGTGSMSPAEEKARMKELREEVEVLEAQLEVKRAAVVAAKVASEAAEAALGPLEKMALRGAANEREVSQARSAAALARAQLLIREAEVREPAVRLKQARERLTEKERASAPPPAAPPNLRLQERLRALEGKLDALRKEVQSLRKELGQEGTSPPGPGAPGMPGRPGPSSGGGRPGGPQEVGVPPPASRPAREALPTIPPPDRQEEGRPESSPEGQR
jgi:RNA polymerase sigma factor (sigma-70 family)